MSDEIRHGGCRCGELRYEVTGGFGPIWNCHCRFCRQIHGAAFTTVAIMGRDGFRWTETSGERAVYETPRGSLRHFCPKCASPICNFPLERELLCLVVSSLDEDFDGAPWAHLNVDSKAPWFEIGDDLPQFAESPDSPALAEMLRRHSS